MAEVNFHNPEFYFNRELSWLEFDQRVLNEAAVCENPLFERLRFLSISANNLDEFFMVRVGSLTDQVDAGIEKPDAAGLTPARQLAEISKKAHALVDRQYEIYNHLLLPQLGEAGIHIVSTQSLAPGQLVSLHEYFTNEVYPVLTPMAVDPGRPFPLILNKSLNIGVILKDEAKNAQPIFATVQVPSVLPRLLRLEGGKNNFLLLDDVICYFIEELFTAHQVVCAYPYRITRNADLEIHDEEANDLLAEMEKTIKKRKRGMAIRLEMPTGASADLVKILSNALEITDPEIYFVNGPLNLTFLNAVISLPGFSQFTFAPYQSRPVNAFAEKDDMFEVIKKGDVFCHHPYDSFDAVVRFVQSAAADKGVLAIKQTLYRVSGNSPIISALAAAAEAGKQVTVLVEVKARFDEENNINWAKTLEKAGCHVIYGLVGLKTHCKITLVVRREPSGIKRYVHLGTGNYNDVTARLYTDMGLFTSNDYIAQDASAIFNMLSGYSMLPRLYKLVPAPTHLREALSAKISVAAAAAKAGKKAHLFAKCNSLVDPQIIALLYEASAAGVKIDLVVRGICCLVPHLPGVSENITVTSIVGRFLEHSRIYYFKCEGKKDELYLSSADLMPRNLDKRVELLFPVSDADVKAKILKIIEITGQDNLRAKTLLPDGSYAPKKITKGKTKIDSQKYFMENPI